MTEQMSAAAQPDAAAAVNVTTLSSNPTSSSYNLLTTTPNPIKPSDIPSIYYELSQLPDIINSFRPRYDESGNIVSPPAARNRKDVGRDYMFYQPRVTLTGRRTPPRDGDAPDDFLSRPYPVWDGLCVFGDKTEGVVPEHAHTAAIFLVFDEITAAPSVSPTVGAFTAFLTAEYHQPVPLKQPLWWKSQLTDVKQSAPGKPRKMYSKAEIWSLDRQIMYASCTCLYLESAYLTGLRNNPDMQYKPNSEYSKSSETSKQLTLAPTSASLPQYFAPAALSPAAQAELQHLQSTTKPFTPPRPGRRYGINMSDQATRQAMGYAGMDYHFTRAMDYHPRFDVTYKTLTADNQLIDALAIDNAPTALDAAAAFTASAHSSSGEFPVTSGLLTFSHHCEGLPGFVHNGVLTAVFDEILAYACFVARIAAFTGSLSVQTHELIPLGVQCRYTSQLTEIKTGKNGTRKLHVAGEVRSLDNATLYSSGTAIFIESPYLSNPTAASYDQVVKQKTITAAL